MPLSPRNDQKKIGNNWTHFFGQYRNSLSSWCRCIKIYSVNKLIDYLEDELNTEPGDVMFADSICSDEDVKIFNAPTFLAFWDADGVRCGHTRLILQSNGDVYFQAAKMRLGLSRLDNHQLKNHIHKNEIMNCTCYIF